MVANIWVAAADNEVDMVKEHLNTGNFTPNSKDPNGYTPMHAAASYGHIELLRLLMKEGGNVNIQDNEGDTPLHHCEDLKTAKVLVEELKADLSIKNNDDFSALQYMTDEDEFPDIIEYLKQRFYGGEAIEEDSTKQASSLVDSLPAPGNVEGHDIRYSLENEQNAEIDEEKRKQIEAIIHGENPEEGLREFVTKAVQDGMEQFHDESQNNTKKRKE